MADEALAFGVVRTFWSICLSVMLLVTAVIREFNLIFMVFTQLE